MPETPISDPVPAPAGRPRRAIEYAPAAPGLFRRSTAATRRWAKDTFARDQLLAGLKQLGWVAPLTVLIWVYAEREQQDDQGFRFPVSVRSSNPQLHVRLLDPADGQVQVTVRGSRSRLEELDNRIGSKDPILVDAAAADGKTGVQSVPMSTILSGDGRFRGLTVIGGTPSVDVEVDPIDEVTLEVTLRPGDALQVQQPVFTPARVKVAIPRRVKKAAQDANQGQLVAYAELGKLTPGKSSQSNVRVVVAGAGPEDVRVEPPTVEAAFDVRAADESLVLPSVPVIMEVVPAVSNAYEIEFLPAIVFNVRVVGTPEAIKQLRDATTRVTASIPVSLDDEAEERDKTINFRLPPDVRLHPKSDHEKTVKLTVSRNALSAE